jgi:hypothetical protein
MFDDETPQEMFNWLKKMANKVKSLGSKRWIDRMLTERLVRAYTLMKYKVVALIHQDPTYKKMTSNDVLERIINHEIIEEVNHIKNLYKGVTTTKKQEIAFKASKRSKNKQVVVECSSEEEEEEEDSSKCDAEEMALFMRKFKKYMNKKKLSKGDKKSNARPKTKRMGYNCGKHGHFIANCPFEHKDDDDDDKKKSKFNKKDKSYKKNDKYYKKNSYGEAHIGQ